MKEQLLKEFKNRFNKDPEHFFFCPGRVNLIGEHIDYNGGKVMPCAISLGTYLAISKNTDKVLRFQSLQFTETAELKLQSSYSKTNKEWFNYPLGIINEMLDRGHAIAGMDLLFSGDLPVGAGLSSSASIEVLTAFAINEIFGTGISKKDIALLARKMENEFIGVSCGIMDQFAVAMAQKDHAMLLNCDTLEFTHLPLQLNEYALAIINTNKQRELADSKYNERFIECGKALQCLKKELSVQHLCEVAPDDLLINLHLINDPVLQKRALHVIAENDRVKQAEKALLANDMFAFGKLMLASHQSLEELYEVSGSELDTIVEFCKNYDDCIGARMTGAGFGGCAIALVKRKCLDDFAVKLSAYYTEKIGYAPDVFSSTAEDGVREIIF